MTKEVNKYPIGYGQELPPQQAAENRRKFKFEIFIFSVIVTDVFGSAKEIQASFHERPAHYQQIVKMQGGDIISGADGFTPPLPQKRPSSTTNKFGMQTDMGGGSPKKNPSSDGSGSGLNPSSPAASNSKTPSKINERYHAFEKKAKKQKQCLLCEIFHRG